MSKKNPIETVFRCRIKSCDGEKFARGYCPAHLRRLYKLGTTLSHIPIKRRTWGSRLAKTKEFRAWTQLRYRCNNPNSSNYEDYGRRGIKVCRRWDKFENFLKDMGKKPGEKFSIERINNNRGYSKANCRWATQLEQIHNRRNTIRHFTRKKILFLRSKNMTIMSIAKRVGHSYEGVRAVIHG